MIEVRASQHFVHHLHILCVDHACLLLQRLNTSSITPVSQQFEYLSKQSFALVHISGVLGLCDLLLKPSEDLCHLIVDHAMNSFDDWTMFYIPTLHWSIQQQLLR